jgi:hypothetical protein
VCTALQAVASPLGHSTAGFDVLHPRADDGIRTRDPHLGKVMRYQLRYIRAQRTRSSPGAKHDDSPLERDHTNLFVPIGAPLFAFSSAFCQDAGACYLRRRSLLGAGPVAQWESVRFTRGRSLVRSQPGPPLGRYGPALLQKPPSVEARPLFPQSNRIARQPTDQGLLHQQPPRA